MTPPVVSVVLAVCGADQVHHLKEAVASVQQQTYRAFECILVADGALPGNLNRFLRTVCSNDKRFRLLRLKKNHGPAAARNAAIAQAQGDFIAILDADDTAEPIRLEEQLVFIGQAQADLVGSFYTLIDQEGRTIGQKQPPISFQRVRRYLIWMNPIGHSTVMGKAAIFKQHPYRETMRVGEDYALWIQLIQEGYRLCNQPEILTRFRVKEDFSSRRRGWKWFRSDLRNRMAALNIYPAWQRPFLLFVAFGMSLNRLIPARLLGWLYRRWLRRHNIHK